MGDTRSPVLLPSIAEGILFDKCPADIYAAPNLSPEAMMTTGVRVRGKDQPDTSLTATPILMRQPGEAAPSAATMSLPGEVGKSYWEL
jgi:hypothetical protein